MKHKVSIVMPVLNGERYLRGALNSILAQTFTDYELIIVNDGSTDNTLGIVSGFEDRMDIRLIHHQERQGIARSVNDGIRCASGSFITFLDHDDAWLPKMLETLVRYLDEHPGAGMVHSDFQTTDSDGSVIEESVATCRGRKRPSGSVFRELFLDSFIVATGVLIRKECLDRVGGFDETVRWSDYHLWLRIARHYEIHYVPDVLVQYRQHTAQATRSDPAITTNGELIAVSVLRSILDLYPEVRGELGERVIRRRMSSVFFGSAYYYFEHADFASARLQLSRAIALWPANPRYHFLYAASLLRPSHAEWLRRTWHLVRARVSPKQPTASQWRDNQVQAAIKPRRS